VKRLAEPRAGLTGREAAFPNARPAAGSGEFQIRSGNRSGLPVGPLPLISKWFLCAFARSGLPRPGALPRSSVGCADPKKPGATPPIPHTGGARRPAVPPDSRFRASIGCAGKCHPPSFIVIFDQAQRSRAFGSPWWASGGRPPRFQIPRGPRIAVRVLAGLSSAFPRPFLGRSAGRGNALCCLEAGFPVPGFRFFGFFCSYPQTPQTPKRYPPKASTIACLDRLGTVWGGVSSPNGPVWGVCGVCTVWGVWAVWGFSVC